ncbi:unnamed protein product, partial [Rotaria magnacalcarata]
MGIPQSSESTYAKYVCGQKAHAACFSIGIVIGSSKTGTVLLIHVNGRHWA